MSGHVQDLWFTRGNDGRLHQTARCNTGLRWKARYIDPDDRERSRSFARKADAERFLVEIEHSKIAGSYLDPDAGRVTLRSRVPLWLDSLTCDLTTRHQITGRVTRHILGSPIADKRLDVLSRSPSVIQSWVAGLPVGAAYAHQLLADLSGIFDAAVADSLIARNPCRNPIVHAPQTAKRTLVPWTRDAVAAIRAAIPERYQAMVDCGAGLGLRQGEIFGLALSEIDWLRKTVHVRQQVRLELGARPVFALPKGGKDRQVPLPEAVSLALAAHVEKYPARPVTLPWKTRDGKPRTELLLFTGIRGAAVAKAVFNAKIWKPARRAAGIPDAPDTGMHQLRHHYASMLLRGGIDIKRVQSYLGHHSASVTLGYYAHLIPDDEDRSLREIEAALATPPRVVKGLKVL